MGYNISILKLLYHGIMIIWVRCNQHKNYIYIYNIANQHTTNTLIYIYIIFNQRTIEYDEPYFLQYEQLLIMNTQNYMEMIPINY
jgi:hypothetical protein